MPQNPQSEIGHFNGFEVRATWIPAAILSLADLDLPFTQCYGFCYDDNLEILIFNHENSWHMPGGTREGKETPNETLLRELREEVNVEVEEPVFLGSQMIEFLTGQDPRSGLKKYYQLRFICKIKKLNPQLPDPDNGVIYERKF